MNPAQPKKQSTLKNGTNFTVLGETKNQERTAFRDVAVEILSKKMGLIYFRLGGMTCRAPSEAIQ